MIDLNNIANSKDRLGITNFEGRTCVTKVFGGDLKRATLSVLKQSDFQDLKTEHGLVTSVEIIRNLRSDKTVELLMPYISGLNGPMFAIYLDALNARKLSEMLSFLVNYELDNSSFEFVPIDFFKDKLLEVIGNVEDGELCDLLNSVYAKLDKFDNSLIFPIGKCHGDLTLNNIIYNGSDILYLIDFLHTFFESPLQDVAKLKQDYDFGWSFRNHTNPVKLNAHILCKTYYPRVITIAEALYPQQVALLSIISLSRIAPYIRNNDDKCWLLNAINNSMATIL